MKKLVAFAAIAIALSNSALFAEYSGGSGTKSDPWQINSIDGLFYLSEHPEDFNSNFILTSDMDFDGCIFQTALIAPDSNNTNWDFDGVSFTGTFNGNNYVIRNLLIDTGCSGNDYLGLFGQIGPNSIIKNVVIEDVNIIGGPAQIYSVA